MVVQCYVEGCKSKYSKFSYISFHLFPKDPARRKEWILAIGRENLSPSNHTVICSKHFVESDFQRFFPTHVLKKTAVPCKEHTDMVTKVNCSPSRLSLSNTVTNSNRRAEINCSIVKKSAIPILYEASRQLLKKAVKNETENIGSTVTDTDCSTPSSLEIIANPDSRPEINCNVIKKSALPILYETSLQLLKKTVKNETENIGSVITEIDCSTPSSLSTVANPDSKRTISPIQKRYRYFGDFKEEDLNDRENVKLMWLAAKKSIALKNRQLKYLRTRNRSLNAKINNLKLALKLRIKSQIN